MGEPSVGELLAAADRDARRLLGQAEPTDGPSLAAGYAGVLHGAYEVLAAIPNPCVGPQGANDHGDYLAVRVTQMISHVDRIKALPVDPHPGTTRIAQTWLQAAALLHRHAHPGLARDQAAREDAAAARVRVARTLAALAHVTGRELQGYLRQTQQSGRAHRLSPPREIPSTALRGTWLPMLQRQEHLALDYLAGHLDKLAGEHRGNNPAAWALQTELAGWSNLANRHVGDPAVSSTDLHHIACTQNAVLNAAGALACAAMERGELPAESGPHLLRRLDTAAAQWGRVAAQWTWARTPDAPRGTPETTSGSAALFGAIQDAARAGPSWASPSEVADRLTGQPLVPILRTITETSEALAEIYQQLPGELHAADRLRAPAATLLAIATENHTATRARPWPPSAAQDAGLNALPVNMSDVARNQLLPLTPAARERMATAGAQLATIAALTHQALLAASPSPPHRPDATLSPSSAAAHRPPSTPAQHHVRRPAPGPGIT